MTMIEGRFFALKQALKLAIILAIIAVAVIIPVAINHPRGQIGDTSSSRAATPGIHYIYETPIPKGGISNELVSTVLTNLNAERVKAGLCPLSYAIELDEAANQRAIECSIKFSHTRPDGSQWFQVNPSVCYGEVLAMNYPDDRVVEAWMKSSSHKECILTPDYHYCGIGYYVNYIVVEFGY